MVGEHTPRRTKSRELSSSHALLSPSSSPSAAARPIASLPRRSSLSEAALKRRSADSSSSPAFAVLWPSASASTNKLLSLADHLGNDRLNDLRAEPKKNGGRRSLHPTAACVASPQSITLGRQRSHSEYSTRVKEEDGEKRPGLKENSPIIGGSMRYLDKAIRFPPSPKPGSSPPSSIPPSRSLIVRGKPDLGVDFPSSESDRGGQLRKPARSLSSSVAYGSATTQWALSPGRRSASPPVVDGPQSPAKAGSAGKGKGGSFISLGLDLFRRKWKENPSSSFSSSKKGRVGDEVGHQLRLLHNSLIQWRWVNARSDRVDLIKTTHAEVRLSGAWVGLSNLQARVVRKRLQLEKDKSHLKLIALLSSQSKVLEEWNEMERQHTISLSAIKDCLQAAVSRLPLADGAKVNPHLLLSALRHATDLASTTRTIISRITPKHAHETVSLLLELRQVVTSEKALLEECFNLLGFISPLHIQEQSLKCHLIQLHLESS